MAAVSRGREGAGTISCSGVKASNRCCPASGHGATRQNSRVPARANPTSIMKLVPSTSSHTQNVRGPAGTASNSNSLPMKPDKGGNPASDTAATRNSRPGTVLSGNAAITSLRSPARPRRRRIRSASRNSAAPAKLLCTR